MITKFKDMNTRINIFINKKEKIFKETVIVEQSPRIFVNK